MSSKDTNQAYTTQNSSTKYHLHVTGEISDDPSVYQDHFQIFRQCTDQDEISLHINSPGGAVYTAAQYINAMVSCKAKITAHIEGQCMSAATFIALAADYWVVHPHTTFMAHNFTTGCYGTGDEIAPQHKAIKDLCYGIMDDLYTGFLTDDEINQIKENNRTYWLTGTQTSQRLENYAQHINELAKEAEEANMQATVLSSVNALVNQEFFVEKLAELGFTRQE